MIVQYCAKLKPLLPNGNVVQVCIDSNKIKFAIVLQDGLGENNDRLEDNNLYKYTIMAINDIGSNSSLAKNLCKSC